MPELAEVEYFRRRWDVGVRQRISAVTINDGKRIFRGNDLTTMHRLLPGATLLGSEARGKQMLFRFSRNAWLGVHLGMTGKLRSEPRVFTPGRHDHLILRQARQSLVFCDPRLFGRVRFHQGPLAPDWWSKLPPALTSSEFTVERVQTFFRRRARSPIKGVLLQQELFIGVGNWMADEILWRAKIHPCRLSGRVSNDEAKMIWKTTRLVCACALRIVAKDFSDPPPSWLFRHRWERGGRCPKDGNALARATIGGRTTAWCPKCQPK